MKILCVHQSSELYGSDRSFVQSVIVLREKYPSAEITVILPSNGPLVTILPSGIDNIIFEDVGNFARGDLRSPLKLIKRMFSSSLLAFRKIREHDLVYVNTIVVFGYVLASIFTKRIVLHVREVPSKLESKVFSLLFFINRSILIFNSHFTKGRMSIFGNKAYVVYNGISGPLNVVENKIKDSVKLLLIGRITAWKGQDVAVDAVRELIESGVKVDLRIVGSVALNQSTYFDELEKKMSDFDLRNNIKIYDFDENPQHHFDWANIVLVPSVTPEPFGRVAIEGMANGRPIIASNHGGLSEILHNNNGGILVSPISCKEIAAAVVKLNSNEMLAEVGESAVNRYKENFSEDIYKINLSSTLDDILKSER